MTKKNWMFVLSVLSAVAGMQLSTSAAQADGVVPNRTGIANGEILMNHNHAGSYCRNQQSRLPTARELALYARSRGAEGISETAKDGYYLVKGTDSAGNADHFYFSYKGYKSPAGDLGNYWFWSSSVLLPDYSDYAHGLYVASGYIGTFYRDYGRGAAGCVR